MASASLFAPAFAGTRQSTHMSVMKEKPTPRVIYWLLGHESYMTAIVIFHNLERKYGMFSCDLVKRIQPYLRYLTRYSDSIDEQYERPYITGHPYDHMHHPFRHSLHMAVMNELRPIIWRSFPTFYRKTPQPLFMSTGEGRLKIFKRTKCYTCYCKRKSPGSLFFERHIIVNPEMIPQRARSYHKDTCKCYWTFRNEWTPADSSRLLELSESNLRNEQVHWRK
jgi:hypothetical protein